MIVVDSAGAVRIQKYYIHHILQNMADLCVYLID